MSLQQPLNGLRGWQGQGQRQTKKLPGLRVVGEGGFDGGGRRGTQVRVTSEPVVATAQEGLFGGGES